MNEELAREIDKAQLRATVEKALHAARANALVWDDFRISAAGIITQEVEKALLPIIERAVAGAYAAAAEIVPDGPLTYTYREAILRLTPADATTAIEREVQAEREAIAKIVADGEEEFLKGDIPLSSVFEGAARLIRARSRDQRSPVRP